MRTVIAVDQTRETISFFGSTAAVEGWRVCIVDTVDELNPNAANALLKVLEEPPQQSLFLLISHAPARVLPTILSRCRKLMLRPLATEDVIRAASQAAGIAADDPALAEAAAASEGSVARALTLAGRRYLEAAATHRRDACQPAAGRSARIACAGRCARHQRPGGAVGLCRQRRPLDGGTAAREPMPMRTCPALHGWRRYGKRSPAPRATPRITIWNENRWFSRCSRCLRTRRGRRDPEMTPVFRQIMLRSKSFESDSRISSRWPEGLLPRSKKKKAAKRATKATKKRAVKKAKKVAKKAAKKSAKKAAKKVAKKPPQKPRTKASQEADRRLAPKPKPRRSQAASSKPARSGKARGLARQPLLHHDRDRLSERPAAYRSRL